MMVKRIETFDLRQTGDPFVDVGVLVIKCLQETFPNKSTFELIEYVTNIYVKQWGGKLNTYFLNSPITLPGYSSEKQTLETLKYYKSIIDETNTGAAIGFCRILGTKTKLYPTGRSNLMMSASGAFINFHSAFGSGLYLSKEALIYIYFVPLGVCQVGNKVALLQSNNQEINYFLIRENVNDNLKNVASGLGEGTLKSQFGIVSNALFNYADFCIDNLKIAISNQNDLIEKDIQLNMYHFTNFGAGPDIDLYSFSNILFKFYAFCKTRYSKEWAGFINQHYKSSKYKNAEFNQTTQEWSHKTERLGLNSYKVWYNPILNKLIKNESIIGNLCRWSRINKFSFNIVEIYCINILKMDKYTIQKIKELSDFILNDKSDDQIKKAIVRLNGLKSSGEFRGYLIKLIKDNYERKNPIPLITIEDYVFYLFPDGNYWKDTRDLLLISIYQKLHEMNLLIEGIPEIEEKEDN